MLCPVCKTVALNNEILLPNLTAKSCNQCGGRWIQSFQYWKWLETLGSFSTEKPSTTTNNLPVEDSSAGKLCPECGHFLSHKKVGHGVDFHLDRCGNCGGIWFDKNEWEILQSKNLHDDVHFVFSTAWQKQIHEDEIEQTQEQRFEKILGPDDYQKTKEIAEWINSHPNKSTILSYISDK